MPMVAIDPGNTSTGWSVLWASGSVLSGQSKPLAAIDAVVLALRGHAISLLTIEEPAFIGQGQMWRLAWIGGEIRGRLARYQHTSALTWTPVPQTWRMVLGLRGRPSAAATEDALAFARDKMYCQCQSPRGKDHVDEAMAVCMTAAARLLVMGTTKESDK